MTSLSIMTSPIRLLQKAGIFLEDNSEGNDSSQVLFPPTGQNIHPDETSEAAEEVAEVTTSTDTEQTETTITVTPEALDLPHLFQMMGTLTEDVKMIRRSIDLIPELQKTVAELKNSVGSQLSDLQARVLVNEEDISALKKQVEENKAFINSSARPMTKKLEKGNLIDRLSSELLDKIDSSEKKIIELSQATPTLPTLELTDEHMESIAQLISNKFVMESDEKLSELNSSLTQRIEELEKIASDKTLSPTQTTPAPTTDTTRKRKMKEPHGKKEADKNKTISSDVLIIGDSNTRPLDLRKFGEGFSRKRYTCYTIDHVVEFIKTAKVEKQPKKIMVHVGTNHIDRDDLLKLKKAYRAMAGDIAERFPDARLYLSSIFGRLTREDPLNDKVSEMNQFIFDMCDGTKGVTYICNNNIDYVDMYDEKHINTVGHHTFVNNIKHTVFGEKYRGYPYQ